MNGGVLEWWKNGGMMEAFWMLDAPIVRVGAPSVLPRYSY